jgi:hypothetical protein
VKEPHPRSVPECGISFDGKSGQRAGSLAGLFRRCFAWLGCVQRWLLPWLDLGAFEARAFGRAFRAFGAFRSSFGARFVFLIESALSLLFLLFQPRELFAPLLALIWRSAHVVLLSECRIGQGARAGMVNG